MVLSYKMEGFCSFRYLTGFSSCCSQLQSQVLSSNHLAIISIFFYREFHFGLTVKLFAAEILDVTLKKQTVSYK